MERRDFLKSLLATALAAPLVGEPETSASAPSLYLISDTPHLFFPPLLREISPRLGLAQRYFSLDSTHPEAKNLHRALVQAGWVPSCPAANPTMALSFQILRAPAFPSFTLTRQGKIQDVRFFNLFPLWEKMRSSASLSSLLTIASFPKISHVLRPGRRAVISVDGRRVASFPLDKDRTESIPSQGGHVVIAIEAGRARVVASTCRHQICLSTPPTAFAGERIVCAPRRFLLEVEGHHFVDTVTG